MGVAGVDLGPGVGHRDHRLAGPVGPVVAHLQRARAMAERPEVAGAVPTVAAQIQIGRATSELQSLIRISYAVFCLKKKKIQRTSNELQDTIRVMCHLYSR